MHSRVTQVAIVVALLSMAPCSLATSYLLVPATSPESHAAFGGLAAELVARGENVHLVCSSALRQHAEHGNLQCSAGGPHSAGSPPTAVTLHTWQLHSETMDATAGSSEHRFDASAALIESLTNERGTHAPEAASSDPAYRQHAAPLAEKALRKLRKEHMQQRRKAECNATLEAVTAAELQPQAVAVIGDPFNSCMDVVAAMLHLPSIEFFRTSGHSPSLKRPGLAYPLNAAKRLDWPDYHCDLGYEVPGNRVKSVY